MIRKPNFILIDNCKKELQEKDAHLLMQWELPIYPEHDLKSS